MRASATVESISESEASPLIGDRYRVVATLGRGGMAIVYRVLDTSTGRSVALKRLQAPTDGNVKEHVALFEREFLTLSNLSHPRVVAVYDYGVDAQGPYYTMELLDGGDLQQLAPVDFRRACALARDVCSTLSLIHSRRMVYRDLSPRNVRCTEDGLAKLIDFGAMAPIGPSRHIVGTLPFCAPEVIHCLPLDARTDLYALGATLYFTLTGRHAYPARDVAQLFDFWQEKPAPPSRLVSGIPESLDALVLELMHMDASQRPASAAEVLERLSAIADLPLDEQLLVSQAYLSAPTLVGREAQVAEVRRMVVRARRRRGTSIVVEGASGVGRSRFLDACVLEAKLAGAVVLRADATDAQEGSFGVVRALAAQLVDALPDLALDAAQPRLALLGHVIPDLLEKCDPVELEPIHDPEQLGPLVQPALRSWLLEIGRGKPIVIAIDDLNGIDDPSLAFVTLLSQHLRQHAITVIGSVESGSPALGTARAAIKLLLDSSSVLALAALSVEQVETMLGSVFGEVPNLQALAHRLHATANGNPRDILRLAQHLVDRRAIHYHAGAWSIPDQFEGRDLPSSMAQELQTRISALSDGARELAGALANEPSQRFSFDECRLLTASRSAAQLLRHIDELVKAEVIGVNAQYYSLARATFASALTSGLTEEQKRRTHLALADVFEQRDDGLRRAQNLLDAGESERAIDVLVQFSEASQRVTDANPKAYAELLETAPRNWMATFESGWKLCETLGRSRRDRFQIVSRVAGMALISVQDADVTPALAMRIEQLTRDTGLDIHATLNEFTNPGERLQQMFMRAGKRYMETPESERVLDPKQAISHLARGIITAVGQIANTFNYEFFEQLPSLEPLLPLSPSLEIVNRLKRAIGCRMTGRFEDANELYRSIVERVSQEDRAGLDQSHALHMKLRILGTVGLVQTTMGLESSLRTAEELGAEPIYERNAVMIRMLYHLWQGATREAERYQRQAEVLRIQNASRSVFDGPHLLGEVCAHALADDLTRIKRTIPAIEPLARAHAGWVPILHFARGEYQRIRGDHTRALRELESGLAVMRPACHQIWPNAAGAHVRTLFELGRYQEARAAGESYLKIADEGGIRYAQNYLRMPLSLVYSKLGEYERAKQLAHAAIDSFQALGSTGLNLAAAYAMRLRIAVDQRDREACDEYEALCVAQLPEGAKRLMRAKYKATESLRPGDAAPYEVVPALHDSQIKSRIRSVLQVCVTSQERARRSIEALVQQSGAGGGLLYTTTEKGLRLWASTLAAEPDVQMHAIAERYFENELQSREATRSIVDPSSPSVSSSSSEWSTPNGERYVPVLLSHPLAQGTVLTGLSLLIVQPGAQFVYPSRLALELSRLLLQHGDAASRGMIV